MAASSAESKRRKDHGLYLIEPGDHWDRKRRLPGERPHLSSQKPVCCKEQELGELEAAGCSTIPSCVNLVIEISQIVKWHEYHKMNGGWEWSLLFLFFPG